MGLVIGSGGTASWIFASSEAEIFAAGEPDESPSELKAFADLAAGYHHGVTALGSRLRIQSGDVTLSSKDLLSHLGAPRRCFSGPTDAGPYESAVTEFGSLYWFAGETECDGVLFPWDVVVGMPENAPPKGVMVLIHGTASSPEQLFGVNQGPYEVDYVNVAGRKALKDGFLVIAPRILTDLVFDSQTGYNQKRNEVDRRAQAIGLRLVGLEQKILQDCIASARREFQAERLPTVIYGVSLGGRIAFHQAAVNPEIDAVIVSQWSESRYEKFLDRDSVHSLWRYEYADYAITLGAAIEIKDDRVAALVHPRPLAIEVGSEDPRSESMASLLPLLEQLYAESPRDFVVVVEDGGHEMFYDSVVPEIWERLSQFGQSS